MRSQTATVRERTLFTPGCFHRSIPCLLVLVFEVSVFMMNVLRRARLLPVRSLPRLVGAALPPRAAELRRCTTRCAAAAAVIAGAAAIHGMTEAEAAPAAGAALIAPVTSLEDDYELEGAVGEGAYAVVRRGRCKRTGKAVAIKTVPKSKMNATAIRHEVGILRRVSLHNCIASLEAFYEAEHCFYIVMEFASGGDLLDHLNDHGAWSEARAATLVQELAGAVALMHGQGLCHADIKPENILLTADGHVSSRGRLRARERPPCPRRHHVTAEWPRLQVKLVDFGLSCEISTTSSKSVGTRAYWPPEVWRGDAVVTHFAVCDRRVRSPRVTAARHRRASPPRLVRCSTREEARPSRWTCGGWAWSCTSCSPRCTLSTRPAPVSAPDGTGLRDGMGWDGMGWDGMG